MASILFALLVLGTVNWTFLRLVMVDNAQLRREMGGIPDRPDPAWAKFLDEVRARSERSSSIAILFPVNPAKYWNRDYAWTYYRAWYHLADRRVLPLMSPKGEPLPANLAGADFVVAWRTPNVRFANFELVWRSGSGTMFRRAPGNGEGTTR